MAISRIVLECPFCSQIFETESPDKLHTAYSLKKPISGIFHGKVVKKILRCHNPKCKRQNTIYWYAPLDYFNRM
jgi:phage FluMu protein Com